MPRFLLPLVIAFAAGVGIGIFCGREVPLRQGEASRTVDEQPSEARQPKAASRRVRIRTDNSSSDATGTSRQRGEACQRETSRQRGEACQSEDPRQPEELVPPATVEVVYADDSSEPSPEISAAHAARRARRQAAREAREKNRQDFLSNLNPDLLTSEQRSRHELYLEATKTRDAARKEIVALRTEGKPAPEELQSRLADAESVLRTDRDAEHRALRGAAARAAGLDETAVRQLMDDLGSIDGVFGQKRRGGVDSF